ITKVLQNLSNDVEFGSKEPYMTKMNDFIHSNREKLNVFYQQLVQTPSQPKPTPVDIPKNVKQCALATLSVHIRENLSKIQDEVRTKHPLSLTLTQLRACGPNWRRLFSCYSFTVQSR